MSHFTKAAYLIHHGHFLHGLEALISYFNYTSKETWDPGAESVLMNLLQSLLIYLNNEESSENLIKCILYALNFFPNNIRPYIMFGEILIWNGEFRLAEYYLLKAVEIGTDRVDVKLSVEKLLLYIKWNYVPRWYYRFFNTTSVTGAYNLAIQKAISNDYRSVLNIQAGCSHFSLSAGRNILCSSVFSFESNYILHQIGGELMSRYLPNLEHYNYFVSQGPLIVAPFLNDRINLIISDSFVTACFGNRLMNTLIYFFNNWIHQRRHRIIPALVKCHVTGIFSSDLDKQFRLTNNIPLVMLENTCVTNGYYGVNGMMHHEEIYKWYDFEVLTQSEVFFHCNLNDPIMVEGFCTEYQKNVKLTGRREGYMNCLLITYDLYLDEDIIISKTLPDVNEALCFTQAIYYMKHPVHIKPDEVVICKAEMRAQEFSFTVKVEDVCEDCFTITEDAISFLNDKEWVDFLIELSEEVEDNKQYILDCCEFPLVGLILAKKGHKVYHLFSNTQSLDFIAYLMQRNNIDTSLIQFIAYSQIPHFMGFVRHLDYAIFEPVHRGGSLNKCPLDNISFKNLEPTLLFTDISVHFVLVYSKCLNSFHFIDKNNVVPFLDLATINSYSGTEHPNFSKIDHEVMSLNKSWAIKKGECRSFTMKIIRDGKVNGIMIWYTLHAINELTYSTKKSSYISTYAYIFEQKGVKIDETIQIEGRYGGGSLLSLRPILM